MSKCWVIRIRYACYKIVEVCLDPNIANLRIKELMKNAREHEVYYKEEVKLDTRMTSQAVDCG